MKIFIKHIYCDSRSLSDELVVGLEEAIENNDAFISINANNCLDFIASGTRKEVFYALIEKLRYNGIISFSGVDLLGLSQAIYTGSLTLQQSNEILSPRNSFGTMYELIDWGKEKGLIIQKAKIDAGFSFYVEMRRPGVENE